MSVTNRVPVLLGLQQGGGRKDLHNRASRRSEARCAGDRADTRKEKPRIGH